MRYVILRDDDTNALTEPHCLERLYRPFLERGLPVNLATIPEVDLNTRMADGTPEGYLFLRTRRDARKDGHRRQIRSWSITCSRIPAITSSSTAATTTNWNLTARIEPKWPGGSERGRQVLVEAGFSEPACRT
jgi:hypothetical protein